MSRLALFAAAAFGLAAGCHQPAQPEYQTAAVVSVPDEQQLDRLWNACTDVLRRYELRPDREDRRAGVITTAAVTSAHWFEFWRQDVVSASAWAESNLATMRRAATVRIDPAERPDEYVLAVRVDVERLSTPERQVTSAAGGLQIFGTKLPTASGELVKDASADRWIAQGRDAALELVLLSRIIDRYGPVAYEYVDYAVEEPAPQTAPAR